MAWWDDPDLHPDSSQPKQAPASGSGMWEQFTNYVANQALRGLSDIPGYVGDAIANPVRDLGDIPEQVGEIARGLTGRATKKDIQNVVNRGNRPGVVSGPIDQAIEKAFPTPPAPNTAAKLAGAAARGITSMGPFAIENPVPVLMSGAGMGLGGEAAHEAFPNSPLAPIVGSLVGGAVGGVVPEGVRSAKTAYSIRRGASMPGYEDVNNVIVNDLEGGGTLANPKVSPKGAMGPQQVMPETARKPGFGIRPWDGKTQSDLARVGRQYSAALMDRYDGDVEKVLAAYNGGFHRVDKAIAAAGDNWLSRMPRETRNYVNKGLRKIVPTGPENLGESSIVQGEQPDAFDQSFANHMLAPFDETTPDKFLEQVPFDKEAEDAKYNLANGEDLPTLTDFANENGYGMPKFAMSDSEGISPGTPEFDKKYGYNQPSVSEEEASAYKNAMNKADDEVHFEDDPYSDYVYDDENPDEEFNAFEEPKPYYDYIGAENPYDKFESLVGAPVHQSYKDAIAKVADQYGVHPYDIAEIALHNDNPLGLPSKDIKDKVTNVMSGKEPLTPLGEAPYEHEGVNYWSLENYENQTGKKVGPLTKQAIKEYAELVDESPDHVASHFFSSGGFPEVKEAVDSYRDKLAKEQMTPKEYKAFKQLPTKDPKVLKTLSKYLGTTEPPKTPGALAKFGKHFVEMLKDNRGGTMITPEEMHEIITDWNKGTHYLMKGPDGTPLRIYHGTRINYEGMPSGEKNRMPEGYVLYSTDPEFANDYAKFYPEDVHAPIHDEYANSKAARVFPAYIKNSKNIGDFRKPGDLAKALAWYRNKYGDNLRWGTEHDLEKGYWGVWEKPEMLRDLHWEGVFLTENSRLNVMLEDHLVKSVLDPETYKNKSLAHRAFNSFVAMLKDDSGSLNFGKDKESGYEGLDPEEKLQKALKSAQPISAEQRRLQSAAKAEKAGFIDKLQQEQEGLAGFKKQAAALKGELPKSDFNSIAEHFSEDDINHLLNKVNASHLLPFEKFRAQTALLKLLGSEGARVPTANEIKLLSGVLHEQTIKAMLNNRPLMERFWRGVGSAINIPRTIMASFDLSAPFRQGLGLIHTKAFWTSFAHMFKQFGSEKAFQAVQDSIRNHPNYPLMRKAGLALADTGHLLMDREEQFMSDFAEKIPVAGKGIHMSNRAYVGFLNKLRADTFNQLIEQGQNLGYNFNHDTKALKDIATFVNTATGRGSLGRFAQAGPFLNSIFFAPRLIASRFNTLFNPMYYLRAEPFVRRAQMKSFVAMGVAATTVLSLAKASGASVSMDPQSPDFMKIKIGHTRLDVLGGYQQYMRLFSQLVKWSYQMEKGHKPKFGERTAGDDIVTFLRNKLNPTVSFGADFFYGKDSTGKKFNAKDEVVSRFIPLFIQDFTDAYKDSGVKGAALAAPGLFGVGVQTYKKKPKKVRQSTRNWWEDPGLAFPAQGKEFKQ